MNLHAPFYKGAPINRDSYKPQHLESCTDIPYPPFWHNSGPCTYDVLSVFRLSYSGQIPTINHATSRGVDE